MGNGGWAGDLESDVGLRNHQTCLGLPLPYFKHITQSSMLQVSVSPLELDPLLSSKALLLGLGDCSADGKKATFPLTHMAQRLAIGFIGSQQQPFISDGCAICSPSPSPQFCHTYPLLLAVKRPDLPHLWCPPPPRVSGGGSDGHPLWMVCWGLFSSHLSESLRINLNSRMFAR